jgi:hypothetical protein
LIIWEKGDAFLNKVASGSGGCSGLYSFLFKTDSSPSVHGKQKQNDWDFVLTRRQTKYDFGELKLTGMLPSN